jgi:glucose-6-phosphate isomerase
VNVGDEAFSFLAAWPGDAGHDYGTIEQTGFAQLVVERGGEPAFVDNPKWARPGLKSGLIGKVD